MGSLSLPRKVTVLGSTGSVGVSTLELFDKSGVDVEVCALVAGRNVGKLAEQALRWRPRLAVIQDEAALPELRERLAQLGAEAVSTGPGEFETMVREYIAGVRKLADAIGMKVE